MSILPSIKSKNIKHIKLTFQQLIIENMLMDSICKLIIANVKFSQMSNSLRLYVCHENLDLVYPSLSSRTIG